jgi:hypothetical protein
MEKQKKNFLKPCISKINYRFSFASHANLLESNLWTTQTELSTKLNANDLLIQLIIDWWKWCAVFRRRRRRDWVPINKIWVILRQSTGTS